MNLVIAVLALLFCQPAHAQGKHFLKDYEILASIVIYSLVVIIIYLVFKKLHLVKRIKELHPVKRFRAGVVATALWLITMFLVAIEEAWGYDEDFWLIFIGWGLIPPVVLWGIAWIMSPSKKEE